MKNDPSVLIRPIEAGDEAEWRRLWRAYLAFYKTERPEQVYATTFARLLSENPNEFSGFIALVDGRPVGLTHYLFHRHAWKIEDVCYLQDLYARPKARNSGIGRALIEAVYAEADKAGCPSVYWLTQDFNAEERRLCVRIGERTPFIKYQRGQVQ